MGPIDIESFRPETLDKVNRLGYRVDAREGGHAGRTFVLRYRGNWGNDHVKIDCIYMNRSPLIPLRVRQSPLRPDLDVLMFDDYELAGGKVKAYFDRVKIRDLYDIGNLAEHCSGVEAPGELLHKVLLYYASLSAHFPNSFIGRSLRFEKCEKEVEEQLVPMLRQLENPRLSIVLCKRRRGLLRVSSFPKTI